MKSSALASLVLGMVFCLPLTTAGQNIREELNTGNSCGFFGETVPERITSFASQPEAEDVIRNIVDYSGLAPNFEVRSGGVPNAAAVIEGNRRFIVYDPYFIRQVNERTGSHWAAVSIMAHEVGHHLNGHTLDRGGSRPDTELEADFFSGFVLQKLGASLDEARLAMVRLGDPQGSRTHPPQRDRLVSITNGWLHSCKLDSACDADTVASPNPTPAQPNRAGSDSCEYARDGECDEPEYCRPGTDATDCSQVSRDTAQGSNSCEYAYDGECDEPQYCRPGTDTADCSVVSRGPNSCEYARDGECDEPSLCLPGTDTVDCSQGRRSAGRGGDSCEWARDGECDEPVLCLPGTDTTDCSQGSAGSGGDSCLFARDGECDEPDLCNPGTDSSDCRLVRRSLGGGPPTSGQASMCITAAGVCPLPPGPVGAPCGCRHPIYGVIHGISQ